MGVIVVGGGLAGLSAAHTLLELGYRVLLLDKKPSLGGNAVKASSGINGCVTQAQKAAGIVDDSIRAFVADTVASAGPELARPHLIDALAFNSAAAIEWLTTTHEIELPVVSRLGGHTIARTHRDTRGSPGWAIMSKLMQRIETLAAKENARVTVLRSARVIRLLQDGVKVTGVEYELNGEQNTHEGNVVLATGGYAADYSNGGYLVQYRSDLLSVPTTNGDHATGDGHRLATSLTTSPAVLCDMDQVQVHPTGFVDPANIDSQTKFLAAEALRAVGGLLINGRGERFVNEVDTRDKVTAAMKSVIDANAGPIRLVLNEAAAKEVAGHCAFYEAKGLMKTYSNVADLATSIGVPVDVLRQTFAAHGRCSRDEESDPHGKEFFHNADYEDQTYRIALMTPVVHYTMGGILVDASARVLDANGAPIPGLFAAGELIGGVHGRNRLGGSSLLEAVVFGRIAGEGAGKD